ncbi:unnamed protein product [Prorocentrum cordatum]|uniref:Uncharacterized protein n=1 Tax=Prorocentrum cordatum TaxID=2364126 RepID=A0ABN9SGD0_9DINO|nr:unnamed protein product [Polarella glacialis]
MGVPCAMVRSLIQCLLTVLLLFADHASAVRHGGRTAYRSALRGKHVSRTLVSNTTDGKVFWRSTVCVNGQCNTTESTIAPDQLRETSGLDGELDRVDNMFGSDFARTDGIFGELFPVVDDFFGSPFDGFLGSRSPRSDDISGSPFSQMLDDAAMPLLTGNLSADGARMGKINATSTSSTIEQILGEDGQVHYTMTTCSNGECKTVAGEGRPDEQAVSELRAKPSDV